MKNPASVAFCVRSCRIVDTVIHGDRRRKSRSRSGSVVVAYDHDSEEDTMAFELSTAAAGEYLKRQGVIPADVTPEARSLGGGVSNHVIAVTWDEACLVAKQPLPNLAVEDDWPADVTRVHNEAAAARAYTAVIDETGFEAAHVPDVVFEDRDEHVIGIECAPDDAAMWKRELLDGDVDVHIARTVGEILGAVHAAASTDEKLRAEFANKTPFDQLRVDPYHRTTANRHPDVEPAIREEVDRIMGIDRTLVHGDYSPKNVLVDRTGTSPQTWILDFEVAHWGDPAFDTAFMLNHLFIKSIYNHDRHREYVDAAFTFWDAYEERVDWDIESETTVELAILMLARVDGKSPVEYVEEGPIADALRAVAKRAIRDETRTLDAFAEITSGEVEGL